MIGFIRQHADIIRSYQQPAIQWAYKQNGTLKANIQYAEVHGVMEGIEYAPMTRDDVTDYFRQDIYRGFIATMLWGGKTRGFHTVVGTSRNNVVNSLNKVRTLLEQGNSVGALLTMYSGNNKIEQVGYSFITKLLYFMSRAYATQVSPRPLILDSHMVVVHCALLLDEYQNGHDLYKWKSHSGVVWYHATSDCAVDAYADYIVRMDTLAASINTSADTLESFLFSFHPADPLSFIFQEVHNQKHLL